MRKILSKSFLFIMILTMSLVLNQQFIFAATTLGSNDHLKSAFFSHLVYYNLDNYTNKKLIDINFSGDKNIAEFSNGFIDAIMDKETYEGKKLSIYLKQNNLIKKASTHS